MSVTDKARARCFSFHKKLAGISTPSLHTRKGVNMVGLPKLDDGHAVM